jgi:flagellar assembly factor FliW
MKWATRQFGELEFGDEHVLTFPEGLIGFEGFKQYLLVVDERTNPFRWLVSIESEDLSFPLLDPSLILPSYAREATADATREVWVIAAINHVVEKSTVNLRSPIVIDKESLKGYQIILDDEKLPLQYPLVPAGPGEGA